MITYNIHELSRAAQRTAIEDYKDRTWCGDVDDQIIIVAMNNQFYRFNDTGELIDN